MPSPQIREQRENNREQRAESRESSGRWGARELQSRAGRGGNWKSASMRAAAILSLHMLARERWQRWQDNKYYPYKYNNIYITYIHTDRKDGIGCLMMGVEAGGSRKV